MTNLPFSKRGAVLDALLNRRIVFLDGAMGTLIQREGSARPISTKDAPSLKFRARASRNNDILSSRAPTN
jgi:methionine synthase I (cobalamin-dependent)